MSGAGEEPPLQNLMKTIAPRTPRMTMAMIPTPRPVFSPAVREEEEPPEVAPELPPLFGEGVTEPGETVVVPPGAVVTDVVTIPAFVEVVVVVVAFKG